MSEISEDSMLIIYAQTLMGRACDNQITPQDCYHLFASAISDGIPKHEIDEILNTCAQLDSPVNQ
jgi:hypothetical protein